AGVVELPTRDHDVDPMNRRQVVEHLHQQVVVPLRVVDGDELRGGIELAQQLVGIGRAGQPLTPAALSISGPGLCLCRLCRAAVCGPWLYAETVLAEALVIVAPES